MVRYRALERANGHDGGKNPQIDRSVSSTIASNRPPAVPRSAAHDCQLAAHGGREPGRRPADPAAQRPAHHDRGLRAPSAGVPAGGDRPARLRRQPGRRSVSWRKPGSGSSPFYRAPPERFPSLTPAPRGRAIGAVRLWARRDSNPLPPASEEGGRGEEGVAGGGKSAEPLVVEGVRESSAAVENAGSRRGFSSPFLQAAGPGAAALRIGGVLEFLTVREVARALRVCTATVYRMCERGELGHVRAANAIRVSAASLAAFIRTCSNDPSTRSAAGPIA